MQYEIKRPDYKRSILSVSSSIMKYYQVKSNYPSLKELDKELTKPYKNVVFLILDCLGENILKNNLEEDSFLRQHYLTNVTTIFPSTTAAATTAIHSGLSAYESGWIGWMPFNKEQKRMIELFTGKDYYTKEKIVENLPDLNYETIYEQITKVHKEVKYHRIFPNFNNDGADTFPELCHNIAKACQNNAANLVSAYWDDPDRTIHFNGVNSKEVKDLLKNMEENIKWLATNLHDTIIIITADHGAVDVNEVYLNEIKELDDCLKYPPSIESRFISFFVKDNKKEEFKKLLQKYFKNGYLLYTKDEFLKENLLGEGIKHQRIDSYLGDYIFISTSDLAIRYSITNEKDNIHLADHAGLTKDEMIVPVITINCK